MCANRARDADGGSADALEARRRDRQAHRVIGLPTDGDHGIGAEGDRDVTHDAQGVIDIQTVENLVDGPAGAQLLGRPPVEGGAVGIARLVNRAQVGRCPAGQHIGAPAKCVYGHGGEVIALGEARPYRDARLLKRAFDDVDRALQFGQQLDEGAVAPGGTGGTFRRRGVGLPGGSLGLPRGLDQPRHRRIVCPHGFDEVGYGQAGLRRLLAQPDAFEPRPEKNTGQCGDDAGRHPGAYTGGKRGSGRWDRHRDHEGEEHAGLRRGQVPAEHPAEGDSQADDEHDKGRQPGEGRRQRADRDQQRAHDGGGQVGERARRTLTAEVRHDEQRKTPEDGEDDVLPAVQEDRVAGEDRRNDDGGTCCTPQRGESRVGRYRNREFRPPRRGGRLRTGDVGAAGAHPLLVHQMNAVRSHSKGGVTSPAQTGTVKI